jgi:hypothetical protein
MKQETFVIDLTQIQEQGKIDEFQEIMDSLHDSYINECQQLSKQNSISSVCASNILYLRSRSRWTQELENELIRMDKEDNIQPNMGDWP